MPTKNYDYEFIDSFEALQDFAQAHQTAEYIAFDTEFIGEKRFFTALCLIQIASPLGNYLIDPIAIENLDPLFDILENEETLIITHAGENDYRILYNQFKVLPQNLFDTQIAAGFLGYRYPMSFGRILESETGRRVGKGYSTTKWDQRPISENQLRYALEDVIFLKEIYDKMVPRLKKSGRMEWANEEFARMAHPDQLEKDPDKSVLESDVIRGLNKKEQLFLLRFHRWRNATAERKDYSKEMVFPGKLMTTIVKGMRTGRKGLDANRRIPNHLIAKHFNEFNALYEAIITTEEQETLDRIPQDNIVDPRQDLITEMLQVLIKIRCLDGDISHQLVLAYNSTKRMKVDFQYLDDSITDGWRRQFLGKQLLNWLQNREHLSVELSEEHFALKLNEPTK